jgi:hypothetical protein
MSATTPVAARGERGGLAVVNANGYNTSTGYNTACGYNAGSDLSEQLL